jgi:hypothetical protein
VLYAILMLAAAAEPAVAPSSASVTVNSRAVELFDRDWVLNQWARRMFDADGDGIISVSQAQPAARAFKEIADADGDGRVTPYECDRAREFILARYLRRSAGHPLRAEANHHLVRALV